MRTKGKGERGKYTQLNIELQRIARRDKKAFLNEQCKEIEENKRMGKTRVLFFLPFHTVHGVLKARMLKWFTTPFATGPCFYRTLHHDLSVLGGPIQHGSQFHLVRQARLWSMWLVWLGFCECAFHSVCPLMNKDKSKLMEASRYWRDWLWGKLVLVLKGGAMLNKSLIQFSVDGQGCFLLVAWPEAKLSTQASRGDNWG